MVAEKAQMIEQLRREILLMEGYKPVPANVGSLGLDGLEAAFPQGVFPRGAVHECLSTSTEQHAATSGFIAGLSGKLLAGGGAFIWISVGGKVFAPALREYGITPEQVVFFYPENERDALWIAEEALKCSAIAVVVAEIRELSFNTSRRLQLAVEKSGATAFVLRLAPRKIEATATAARWQIRPLASDAEDQLPGVGHTRWEIQLTKVRSGKTGIWQYQWIEQAFEQVVPTSTMIPISRRKTG